MKPSLAVLAWLATFAIAAAVAIIANTLFGNAGSPGRDTLARHVSNLDSGLKFVRASISGRRIAAMQMLTIAACATAAVSGRWPALLVAVAAAAGPGIFLERLVASRAGKLDGLVEPWLNAIANSLKASPSLGDAIASSVALVPAPMSEEIDVLTKECNLGTPLDEALDNLATRVGAKTVSGAVLALKVSRRSGGNLTEMLEQTAAALRELGRLEGVVRTKTAEGKAQAFVIGFVPVPMIAGVQFIDPGFFRPLETTFMGNAVAACAMALWILAVVTARGILAVDV